MPAAKRFTTRNIILAALALVICIPAGIWAVREYRSVPGPEPTMSAVNIGPLEPIVRRDDDAFVSLTVISLHNDADDRLPDSDEYRDRTTWEMVFEIRNVGSTPYLIEQGDIRLLTTHGRAKPESEEIQGLESDAGIPLDNMHWVPEGDVVRFNAVFSLSPRSTPRWLSWSAGRHQHVVQDLQILDQPDTATGLGFNTPVSTGFDDFTLELTSLEALPGEQDGRVAYVVRARITNETDTDYFDDGFKWMLVGEGGAAGDISSVKQDSGVCQDWPPLDGEILPAESSRDVCLLLGLPPDRAPQLLMWRAPNNVTLTIDLSDEFALRMAEATPVASPDASPMASPAATPLAEADFPGKDQPAVLSTTDTGQLSWEVIGVDDDWDDHTEGSNLRPRLRYVAYTIRYTNTSDQWAAAPALMSYLMTDSGNLAEWEQAVQPTTLDVPLVGTTTWVPPRGSVDRMIVYIVRDGETPTMLFHGAVGRETGFINLTGEPFGTEGTILLDGKPYVNVAVTDVDSTMKLSGDDAAGEGNTWVVVQLSVEPANGPVEVDNQWITASFEGQAERMDYTRAPSELFSDRRFRTYSGSAVELHEEPVSYCVAFQVPEQAETVTIFVVLDGIVTLEVPLD